MRLILALLAVANLRWAAAERERAYRLGNEADAATARCRDRMALAESLATRAGLTA